MQLKAIVENLRVLVEREDSDSFQSSKSAERRKRQAARLASHAKTFTDPESKRRVDLVSKSNDGDPKARRELKRVGHEEKAAAWKQHTVRRELKDKQHDHQQGRAKKPDMSANYGSARKDQRAAAVVKAATDKKILSKSQGARVAAKSDARLAVKRYGSAEKEKKPGLLHRAGSFLKRLVSDMEYELGRPLTEQEYRFIAGQAFLVE